MQDNYKFNCFQRLELIDKLEKIMSSDDKSTEVRKELYEEFYQLSESVKTIQKKVKDRVEDTVYQLKLLSEMILCLQ